MRKLALVLMLPVLCGFEGRPWVPFVAHMDERGNESNSAATGDYSSTTAYFEYRPPAGTIVRVHRLIVLIEDSQGIDADSYGNTVSLTNGILVQVVESDAGDGATVKFQLEDDPIKDVHDWSSYTFDATLKSWGTGNDFALFRWSFTRFSSGIYLDGDKDEAIRIVCRDNMTHLIDHKFTVQGEVITQRQR